MVPLIKNKKYTDPPINYVSKNANNAKFTGEQALLIDTYVEEHNKWSNQLTSILNERNYLLTLINEIIKNCAQLEWKMKSLKLWVDEEPEIQKFLFKWFKFRSRNRKEYDHLVTKFLWDSNRLLELEDKYEALGLQYNELSKNPPNMDKYEVALLGNSIFKPR